MVDVLSAGREQAAGREPPARRDPATTRDRPAARPVPNGPVPVEPPTMSVVLCCYTLDRWERVTSAVASLQRQSLPPHEILVVVDHCPPLAERARAELTGVRVIESDRLPGLSGARNAGTKAADGDVVAFLDDDATATSTWLQHLADEFADPEVIGVGGRTKPRWEVDRPRWFPSEFDWVVGCTHSGMPARATTVRNLIGANMSFRRWALLRLGGFRTDLGRRDGRPFGCEETEFCIRSAALGGRLVYQPAALVHHHISHDRQTWAYFRARCFAEGESKAAMTAVTGVRSGLSDERRYLLRTLPAGVTRSLLLPKDRTSPRRAAVMVAGSLETTTGYVRGRVALRAQRVADTVSRAAGAVGTSGLAALRLLLPLLIAVASWTNAVRDVTLTRMGDLGLVSVLPVTFWVAVAVLCVSVVVLIHRARAPEWVLGAYVATLIVVLHGTPALLYPSPRYAWTWKHVGIVDYVIRHNAVDPTIGNLGAYHDWPGFFTIAAVVTKGSGLQSALSFAGWAPPVVHLLYLPLLVALFRTLTRDRRRVWAAVLLFLLTDWVGQEYFSPQAFAYLLYLALLLICLRWLPVASARTAPRLRRLLEHRPALTRAPITDGGRRILLGVVVVLMGAIASSHQLTPFMAVSTLVLLLLARQVGPWWLPWLMAAISLVWVGVVARPFVADNLYWIVQSIGRPAGNTQTNFIDLSLVPPEQRVVAWADRALTAVTGLLAAVGWWRTRRAGRFESIPALLAIAPLPMVVANSYGGEMLFRVFLFALPGLVILAAAALYPCPVPVLSGDGSPSGGSSSGGSSSGDVRSGTTSSGVRRRRGLPTLVTGIGLSLALAGSFSLAYYGKERMNFFTPAEVAGSSWLYGHAPSGSFLVAPTADLPWGFTHYEAYQYLFLEELDPVDLKTFAADPEPRLVNLMRASRSPDDYLIVTRSTTVAAQYTGSLPQTLMPALDRALAASPDFSVAFRNADVVVYQLRDPSAAAPPTAVRTRGPASTRSELLAGLIPSPSPSPTPAASTVQKRATTQVRVPARTRSASVTPAPARTTNPPRTTVAPVATTRPPSTKPVSSPPPTSTSPVAGKPVSSSPVSSPPVSSPPVGSSPVGSSPVVSSPVGSAPSAPGSSAPVSVLPSSRPVPSSKSTPPSSPAPSSPAPSSPAPSGGRASSSSASSTSTSAGATSAATTPPTIGGQP
jgi:GT2 family glycosyltransferase